MGLGRPGKRSRSYETVHPKFRDVQDALEELDAPPEKMEGGRERPRRGYRSRHFLRQRVVTSTVSHGEP